MDVTDWDGVDPSEWNAKVKPTRDSFDASMVEAQTNYTYEINNYYISEADAKKIANDLLGINFIKTAQHQEVDYLRVLRSYFTTGTCKAADDTFGTVGNRKWWVIFKAPDEVMPLLINDPEYKKFALWRMENGPVQEDLIRKQAEVDKACESRMRPWDRIAKKYIEKDSNANKEICNDTDNR